jgi:hypothetical protein
MTSANYFYTTKPSNEKLDMVVEDCLQYISGDNYEQLYKPVIVVFQTSLIG